MIFSRVVTVCQKTLLGWHISTLYTICVSSYYYIACDIFNFTQVKKLVIIIIVVLFYSNLNCIIIIVNCWLIWLKKSQNTCTKFFFIYLAVCV